MRRGRGKQCSHGPGSQMPGQGHNWVHSVYHCRTYNCSSLQAFVTLCLPMPCLCLLVVQGRRQQPGFHCAPALANPPQAGHVAVVPAACSERCVHCRDRGVPAQGHRGRTQLGQDLAQVLCGTVVPYRGASGPCRKLDCLCMSCVLELGSGYTTGGPAQPRRCGPLLCSKMHFAQSSPLLGA